MKRSPGLPRMFLLSVVLVLGLLLVSGCGGGGGDTQQQASEPTTAADSTSGEESDSSESDSGDASSADEGAADEDTADEDTADESAASSETVDIEVGSGLDELDSYSVDFTMAFEGEDSAGTDQSGTINMIMDIDNTTEDMHATMNMSGPAMSGEMGGGEVSMETYQVGGDAYLLMDMGEGAEGMDDMGLGGACIKTPGSAEDNAPNLNEMVGEIKDARLIQEGEDINGIKADHYEIQDVSQAFGTAELDSVEVSKADVWIAQDGGYVVKLDIEASGVDAEGLEGSFNMQLEVSDLNEVDEIVLPESCENATDMPGMPVPEGEMPEGDMPDTTTP